MSMGKQKFHKLTPEEVDNVNRPIIMKETERLKKKRKAPKLDVLMQKGANLPSSFYESNITLIKNNHSLSLTVLKNIKIHKNKVF